MVGHMSIGMIIPKLYTFGLLIYLWPYLYMNNTYDGIGMTIPIIGMVGHSAECKKFELWDRDVAQVAKGSFMTLGRLPMFKSFY